MAGIVFACVILLAAPIVASGAVYSADEEIICVGDSCQSLPPEPEDPTPGTLVPNPGNPPLHISEPKKKKKKAKHRHKHRNGHRGAKRKHGQGKRARGPTR